MAIDNNDTFLINDRSKDLMDRLKSAIRNNFEGIWMYLYKMKDGDYELYAANNWGGRLDKETASEVKLFVTEFMIDPANKHSAQTSKKLAYQYVNSKML